MLGAGAHRLLTAVGTLAPVLAQHHVFSSLADAVAHARQHVARTPQIAAPAA